MNLETFNVSNAEFVNEQTNYGRRRVGKTSLIREFIKEKQALYYLATEENIHINRKIFKDEEIDVVTLDNSENTIVFGE
jgi:AAA+ ATPase superfamily predicted ATPase